MEAANGIHGTGIQADSPSVKPSLIIPQDLSSGIIDPFEDYLSTADYTAFGARDCSKARNQYEGKAGTWPWPTIPFSDAFFYSV